MTLATYKVEHDLAQQHVLECAECTWVVLSAEVLERLVEVGVCGGVVLVFCVQNTGLKIQTCLEVWWTVY